MKNKYFENIKNELMAHPSKIFILNQWLWQIARIIQTSPFVKNLFGVIGNCVFPLILHLSNDLFNLILYDQNVSIFRTFGIKRVNI